MIDKYCGGIIPAAGKEEGPDAELKELATTCADKVEEAMNEWKFNIALEEIWKVVQRTNKYIDETTPWVLAKDEANKERLDVVMHNLAESLRIIANLIYPYMHTTSSKIQEQLGLPVEEPEWEETKVFDMIGGEKVCKGDPIFPRLDIEKELAELEKIKEANMAAAQAAKAEEKKAEFKPEIKFDDFDKVDLRIGTVVECEPHPDSKKLLVFKVDIGSETRQILSGCHDWLTPEQAIGQKVIVVANLKTAKMGGMDSEGMILFAETKDADGKTVKADLVAGPAENGTVVD